jgi:hypothetical protein
MGNFGLPNKGKTTITYNIMAQADPPYKYVFLAHPHFFKYHCDADVEAKDDNPLIEYDKDGKDPDGDERVPEYQDVKYIGLKWIPATTYWSGNKKYALAKKLLILDDIDIKSYVAANKKLRSERINKLMSFSVTHSNLSVIICLQDMHQQGIPGVYRLCNFFSIFPYRDKYQIGVIAGNVGLHPDQLKELFSHATGKHDSIQIDYTDDSPMPFRLNFTTPIQLSTDLTRTPFSKKRQREEEPQQVNSDDEDPATSRFKRIRTGHGRSGKYSDRNPLRAPELLGGGQALGRGPALKRRREERNEDLGQVERKVRKNLPLNKMNPASIDYMKKLIKKIGSKNKVL